MTLPPSHQESRDAHVLRCPQLPVRPEEEGDAGRRSGGAHLSQEQAGGVAGGDPEASLLLQGVQINRNRVVFVNLVSLAEVGHCGNLVEN